MHNSTLHNNHNSFYKFLDAALWMFQGVMYWVLFVEIGVSSAPIVGWSTWFTGTAIITILMTISTQRRILKTKEATV